MARYFFDLRDGEYIPDTTGTELASLAAARDEAAIRLGGLLRDDPAKFWSGDEWHIDVKNEWGLILFSICIVAQEAAVLRCQPKG